jgi:Bacterial toxin homologue of phage lysozyme, C-term
MSGEELRALKEQAEQRVRDAWAKTTQAMARGEDWTRTSLLGEGGVGDKFKLGVRAELEGLFRRLDEPEAEAPKVELLPQRRTPTDSSPRWTLLPARTLGSPPSPTPYAPTPQPAPSSARPAPAPFGFQRAGTMRNTAAPAAAQAGHSTRPYTTGAAPPPGNPAKNKALEWVDFSNPRTAFLGVAKSLLPGPPKPPESTGATSSLAEGMERMFGPNAEKTSMSSLLKVDPNFFAEVEGSESKMYVPPDKQRNSGPTIGKGVDLGRKTVADLEAYGLPPSLVSKLSPYLGMTGDKAEAFVSSHPLVLSSPEQRILDKAVQTRDIEKLVRKFNAASKGVRFDELPANTQTAIASLYFQYGVDNPQGAAPIFWRQITTGDWQGAHANLLKFGDDDEERRHKEAGLIADDIKGGRLPKAARGAMPQ